MTADRATVRMPDGGDLEVLRHGAPDAFPLVFQCGTPNAPDEFPPLFEAVDARGWQLIAPARPGYAGSSRQEGRSVADAAGDVAAVLDAFGLDRFFTLGWSGGGPHALSCAALLPDRCRAAASLAGVAPYDAEGLEFLAGMGEENVEEFSRAARSRADGDLAETMARMIRRALSSGIAGWVDDDLAFVKPWGFDLGAVAVPASIWQGARDRMVPFAHGEWLAAHIPGVRVHLYEDEGHISLASQLPRILGDLSDG